MMTDDEIETTLVQHQAAFAAIGHPLTEAQMALTERQIRGEITFEQAQAIIIDKARAHRPVAHLPATDEETTELEGTESWLSTLDDPNDATTGDR